MHIGLNAHLLSKSASYRSAGIHTYIHQLLTHLPQVAPDDWRFTAMLGGDNPARYEGISLRHSRWDTERPFKRILWEQLAQPTQLSDYDLLHAMAFVAPLVLPNPMVVTVYDLSFLHYPERLSPARRLYLRLLNALTCHRAKRVLAISHSTGRDVTDLLDIPAAKIDVTPLAVDTDVYKPLPETEVAAFRKRENLPERFWFFLGTLEPRKNLPMLLEAYAKIPEQARLPLILAGGKGWGYEPIDAAIERYQLQDTVRLTGFLPTDDLPLWYNSAEVFVYPSVFEGFGFPVLEAMACGTPVMTSNVSSLPEVAGQAGICLPPDEPTAWVDALRKVYHDAEWREAASNRGLTEAEQYQWTTTAQQTIASYRRALEEDT